mgnify:CR=1 FL=1
MSQNKFLKYFFFNIIGLLILVSLGTWQLERLQWKERYINKIVTQMSLPAVSINSKNILEFSNLRYRKIKISGYYLYGKKIAIHSKVFNKIVGKHIIVPFKSDFGYILVNRGFIPNNKSINIEESTNIIEISGIINFVNKKSFFIPDNDLQNNDWYYVNIDDFKKYSNLNLLDFYVIEENNPLEVLPIGSQYNLNIPNDHLQYAITWFSLAFVLCIFMHLIWKKYD